MLAFGCSITMPEVYEECAGAGIALAREPDSAVFANSAAGPISRSYNLVLEQAGALDGLEGVVLLHQDARIVDPRFAEHARRALQDPAVAVVGCVGAVGARSIAWWEAAVTWETFAKAYGGWWGGGASPAVSDNGRHVPATPLGEVDTVDGFVMVLAPWAVRHLRFDEALTPLVYGFDFDFCQQVRAAGRKVVAADLGVVHERPELELVTDDDVWTEAYLELAEKWEGRVPGQPPGKLEGEARARRLEAEAGATKLAATSKMLQSYAQADELEADLRRVTHTRSWRVTRPLRELNLRRRRLRAGADGAANG